MSGTAKIESRNKRYFNSRKNFIGHSSAWKPVGQEKKEIFTIQNSRTRELENNSRIQDEIASQWIRHIQVNKTEWRVNMT